MTVLSRAGAPARDPAALADALVAFTVARLEDALEGPLAGWTVPRRFGGHAVAADVRADLIYTLGLLGAAGVGEVAGRDVDEAIAALLGEIDGRGTNTFFSYRVSETLARRGVFEGNPLLAGLDAAQRDQVAQACDSTDWIELFEVLPRNYGAVLARCELGRERLGLGVDPDVLADLLARARALLEAPGGYHDDSEDGTGHRYDIYTADLALFSEPLAARTGGAWDAFARRAVALVERTALPSGAAIGWGRSTGVLATCLTIELAAMVLADPERLDGDPRRWLALGANAATRLDGWFEGGVITAHQHRSPYGYRGPARRLQMTFDVLGKLAWSAVRLSGARFSGEESPLEDPFDDIDEVVRFDERAGVWVHRSRDLVVQVPFVGPTQSDYQPAPRNPGTFEVPVDQALPTWVPVVEGTGVLRCGGGPPTSLEPLADGGVRARWDQLADAGGTGASGDASISREVTIEARGRSLVVTEALHLGGDRAPASLGVTVPEVAGRPLVVSFDCPHDHAVRRVDVDGVGEWRSFWGCLDRLHELDVAPSTGEVGWRYEVTPAWRVATESGHHHYHRSLYRPMGERVVEHGFSSLHLREPERAVERLADVDLFHLHWPEWFTGADLELARVFLDVLEAADVRLVWTQHNLRPHRHDEAFDELYRRTAAAAHGVIHHSAWGRDRVMAQYRFRDDAAHAVIPHGHFGHLRGESDEDDRARAEAELGLPPLPPGGIRVGVVGAPRQAKRTVELMEAFTAVDRDDLQLLVLSLDEGEVAPDDPRLVALPYEFVDRDVYNRRLATIDVVALPFAADGEMLTTGVVADVIGWGMPALASSWTYLTESLGAASLPLGDSVEEMAASLAALDGEALEAAASAVAALADSTSWERVAELTLGLFEAVGTAKR